MGAIAIVSVLTAAAIGAVAWGGSLPLIALSAAMPCLAAVQESRLRSASVALAYYATASYPVVGVINAFQPGIHASFFWLLAVMMLSAPWFLIWSEIQTRRILLSSVAILVSALPPLCVIGWASPLLSAGILFPGLGLVGLLIAACLPLLLLRPYILVPAAFTISLAANLSYPSPKNPPEWQAINTYERPARDFGEQSVTEHRLQVQAARSLASFLVFPECAVRRWTDVTEASWIESQPGKTLLIGTTLPIGSSQEYLNAVFITAHEPFIQRIPVPIAMWKPLGPKDGVPLNLFGPGTETIGRERAAILICYEQLLIWPMLRSALDRPTIVIAVADVYWTKHTGIPAAQLACLKSWGRLFGIPAISAVNS